MLSEKITNFKNGYETDKHGESRLHVNHNSHISGRCGDRKHQHNHKRWYGTDKHGGNRLHVNRNSRTSEPCGVNIRNQKTDTERINTARVRFTSIASRISVDGTVSEKIRNYRNGRGTNKHGERCTSTDGVRFRNQ